MPTIEVDSATDEKLAFASAITGTPKGEIVARLVLEAAPASLRSSPKDAEPRPLPRSVTSDDHVDVYVVYNGQRTNGLYDPSTHRIDVSDGPLAGISYNTPSQAARAVVYKANPEVNPNRNGWSFWRVASTGALLQSVRWAA